MLDLTHYNSLGKALEAAFECWSNEVCLYEADRERQRSRHVPRIFRCGFVLAGALQEAGFAAGDRAAIIMTNQPKWLMSAYAVFGAAACSCRSYKLTAARTSALLDHSQARFSFCGISDLARDYANADFRRHHQSKLFYVTEAPAERGLCRRSSLGRCLKASVTPDFRSRQRERPRLHRLFLRHGRAARKAACSRTAIIWNSAARSTSLFRFHRACAT